MKTPKAALRAAGLGLAIAAAALCTTGCFINQRSLAKVPVRPPYGLIYTDYKAPLDFRGIGSGKGASFDGLKTGSSEVTFIGLPYYDWVSASFGDASLETSQKNGNLETVEYADYEYFTILGIYTKFTVHAHGK